MFLGELSLRPRAASGRELHARAASGENLFRKIFLSSHDAILLLSSTGDEFLDVNPQASALFGYSKQEFLHLAPRRTICVHKGEWELLLGALRVKRDKWLRRVACRQRSGRIILGDILPSLVQMSGAPCILATVQDVSDRGLSDVLRADARFTRFSNAVGVGAAQAPSIEHAVRFCLQNICDYAHWVFAHAHIFSRKVVAAHCPADTWHFGLHESAASVRAMVEADCLVFPEKWYSRLLANRGPSIVEDLQTELEFAAKLRGRHVSLQSALVVPILAGDEIIGVCQYFSAEPISRDPIFLNTLNHLAGRLGHIIEQKLAQEAVHSLSMKLFHAQDEERSQLARELHDTTAQNVTAALMDLSVIEREDALPPKARHALSEGISLLRRSLQELRTLSYVLHPPMLDELGLVPALRILIEGFEQRSGMHVRLDVPESFSRFPKELEITLYRVVQEGLTNARRHSGSVTANVTLMVEAGELRLSVENETTSELLWSRSTADPSKLGVGLRSMQERVKGMGGNLILDVGKNRTVLRASFPLAEVAKATSA